MNKKVISYLPYPYHKADTPNKLQGEAVVTEVQNNIPLTVTLNDISLAVVGYYSMTPWFVPNFKLGDNVLVTAVPGGVKIVGVDMSFEESARVSLSVDGDNLVIEAKGSVVLKNEHATIELTKDGAIFIDGENVRTVAEQTLTLLGGKVLVN